MAELEHQQTTVFCSLERRGEENRGAERKGGGGRKREGGGRRRSVEEEEKEGSEGAMSCFVGSVFSASPKHCAGNPPHARLKALHLTL